MAGVASPCQVVAATKCILSHSSSSAGASPSSSHPTSRLSLGGARTCAAPFSYDVLSYSIVGSPCTSGRLRNGSLSSSATHNLQLNQQLNQRRPQMGAVQREEAGIARRKKQGVICQALAPASREEKEYDYDSPKMKELMAFLERDLVHLFDEQGIDKNMYDQKVNFKDPISKYGSLDGYLFNIQFLRRVLTPKFELHSVKQTGPKDITTRWTMTMYFLPVPWRPELIFTGTSVMSVNPETGKFRSHIDYWDSVQNNEFLSFEAVVDLVKQLQWYKTPDLETPNYRVLKRTSLYQVREYEQFLVAETAGDQIAGNKGFNEVAGYLFGKNSTGEKMKMTTPVFNQIGDKTSQLQFVLPIKSQRSSIPAPISEQVKVRPVEKTFAAVIKFSGEANEATVKEKERTLRAALIKDGQQPEEGFLLARYNDPGSTWAFLRRNEVIIWLKGFTLETD